MSRRRKLLPMLLVGSAILTSPAIARSDVPGCAAAGAVPAALPSRMLFGWGDNYDQTWAKDSGTRWDVQWMYFSGQAGNNWYNTWGFGAADGSFLDTVLSTIDSYGFMTGIHLYNMGYGHDRGDSGLVTEIQDASFTRQYFTEFKAMMQKIKNFAKPVIVVIEGDSFGMVEMLVNNDPTTPAAVASTGLPELAGLPNTVAGFGLAFLAIRKSVGAYNAVMGPDTPYYAADGDIMNWPDTQPLQTHVDYQWKFFGPLGVGQNVTGDRFDFSASCPSASDCAAYSDGRPCWDPSDSASTSASSINRYLEWLRLYNRTSGVRWMLHQVPIGNSQHRNVPYDGSTRSGYRDNKVEYLFQYESPASTAIRSQHLANFANAGVLGILFGFSDDGDTPWTDLWQDNQPFLKSHVAAVNGDGFAIASSGGCGDGGSGGSDAGGNAGSNAGSSHPHDGGAAIPGAGGKNAEASVGSGGRSGWSDAGLSRGSTGGGGTGATGLGNDAAAGITEAGAASTGGTNPAGAMGGAGRDARLASDASPGAFASAGGSTLGSAFDAGDLTGRDGDAATQVRPAAAGGCGCAVGSQRANVRALMIALAVMACGCRRRRRESTTLR